MNYQEFKSQQRLNFFKPKLHLHYSCYNQVVEHHIKIVTKAYFAVARFKRFDGYFNFAKDFFKKANIALLTLSSKFNPKQTVLNMG